MARATIDASVIGDNWFQNLSGEILKLRGLDFVYGLDQKTLGEHERSKKLGQFYALASRLGREVIAVPADEVERHMAVLADNVAWKNEGACDDPHIFAIVYERNVRYVFTREHRLAACRDCIIRSVGNKYCNFVLIRSEQIFREHRHHMIK
jgi:hypothetical protein